MNSTVFTIFMLVENHLALTYLFLITISLIKHILCFSFYDISGEFHTNNSISSSST
jgi:hypothetical protein